MKTIFRFFGLGLVLTALLGVGATTSFAQDDYEAKLALYNKFMENYQKKDAAAVKAAAQAGKEYVEKYPNDVEQVKFISAWIPRLETAAKSLEFQPVIDRFNAGLKSKNWDDVYASGKEILAQKPEEYGDAVTLVLGSIGVDETAKTPRNLKYNAETLVYAKKAIADLEGGKTYKTFGVAPFVYKNKEDALGWMNYTIGYILTFGEDKKKEGAAYFYKATQYNSDKKSDPNVYAAIGDFYFDEVKRLTDEAKVLNAAIKADDPVEVKQQKDAEVKAKMAVLFGYTERAMDAYARAHKLISNDPKNKAAKDRIYQTLQTLYTVRFEKQDGMDAFISSLVSKPMPNPTTAVTPVTVTEPSTDTDATTGTATPAKTTAPVAKKSGNR